MKSPWIAGLGALLLASGAADPQTGARIRGTITAFEGNVLSVRSREGGDLRIELTEKPTVAAARAIALADVNPGDCVGVTTRQRADGVRVALEVHTLPRAVPEGVRAWDLEPDTVMTNAVVVAVVRSGDAHQIALEYQGGSQQILVRPGTPIVTTVAADRSFLRPGEYVFLTARVEPEGKLAASGRIQVSHGGVKPPQ